MSQATARKLEQQDNFELGFEELDEPIFAPSEIDPGGHHVDGQTQLSSDQDSAD